MVVLATIQSFLGLFEFFCGAQKKASDLEFNSSSIGPGYAISRISLNSNNFKNLKKNSEINRLPDRWLSFLMIDWREKTNTTNTTNAYKVIESS
jgi:hypothetical protein